MGIVADSLLYFSIAREGQIYLSGFGSNSKGLVEIYHNNIWGTICSSGFTLQDSIVVCRQLGYNSAINHGDSYGSGFGSHWLNRVNCTGSEASLTDCPRSSWGSGSCSFSNPVGVTCINGTANIAL